jgi:hypothetical protein
MSQTSRERQILLTICWVWSWCHRECWHLKRKSLGQLEIDFRNWVRRNFNIIQIYSRVCIKAMSMDSNMKKQRSVNEKTCTDQWIISEWNNFDQRSSFMPIMNPQKLLERSQNCTRKFEAIGTSVIEIRSKAICARVKNCSSNLLYTSLLTMLVRLLRFLG